MLLGLRSALSTNSYEKRFTQDMFFNDTELELVESVLLAKLVYGVFNRISSWHGTRKSKKNMPDDHKTGTNVNRDNADDQAGI